MKSSVIALFSLTPYIDFKGTIGIGTDFKGIGSSDWKFGKIYLLVSKRLEYQLQNYTRITESNGHKI